MKIIWIDGIFGSGKTAVANSIVKRIENACILEFDNLQKENKPNSISVFFGERYPEAKRYLIDALASRMLEMIQEDDCEYIIIPIALINDYCNQKLVNAFGGIKNYHFILTASTEIWRQRIENQKNRDTDLAITYRPTAMMYLNNHYADAIRIDTSDMNIDSVARKIVEIILLN